MAETPTAATIPIVLDPEPKQSIPEAAIAVLSLVIQGQVPVEDAADELGVSPATIYRWCSMMLPSIRLAAKQERNKKVIKLYQDGLPVHQVLSRSQVSQGTMYAILRSAGIQLRRERDKQPTDDLIISMYKQDETILSIELKTGKSTYYIYRLLHSKKIPLRRGQK